MRHTLVDLLAPKVTVPAHGNLRTELARDLAVDTEARATWARLGQ